MRYNLVNTVIFFTCMCNSIGLVLVGDDEAALECFESLISLAKEQLNHVFTEKSKLPSLSPLEKEEICRQVCTSLKLHVVAYVLQFAFSVLSPFLEGR